MLWKSPHPDLDSNCRVFRLCLKKCVLTDSTVPKNLTTWEWAFESPEYSPVLRHPKKNLGSYINAITKERLDFADVKLKATLLSAALVTEYGLQPGDTVSLFSTNTIWYPVAMWATIRAGMSSSTS